jgi:uncharacterized protein YjbI with pentapeptide repeats
MRQIEIKALLAAHAAWMRGEEGGKRADLSGMCVRSTIYWVWGDRRMTADLYRADLRGAVLRGASLRQMYCVSADLRGADLRGADLRAANLTLADLRGALLDGALLDGALLDGALVAIQPTNDRCAALAALEAEG